MTDPERDFSRTFAGLREAVREHAAPPAAAAIRGRAEHQVRVRRTTAALVVAAAVAVVAVGSVNALRGDASRPPVQPGTTTAPATPDPSAPSPSATPTPRPTSPPSRVVPNDDPIVRVNWSTATIRIPREGGCPVGDVRFRKVPDDPDTAWNGEKYPRIFLRKPTVAYGNLLGDARAEAVLEVSCLASAEDSGDGSGRLLVVARDNDGRLGGVAWVGQPGAMYNGQWITDGRLYTDVAPWHVDWGYSLGQARAYQWRSSGFDEVDVRDEFPGLWPVRGRPGTPIDLAPVADRLRCADGAGPITVSTPLRFGADGKAKAGAVTWDATQPLAPDSLPHLVDLDGDGNRRLLVSLACGPGGDKPGLPNLVLLGRSGDSYRAIDVVAVPRDPAMLDGNGLYEWRVGVGTLTIRYSDPGSDVRYRWNGERFAR